MTEQDIIDEIVNADGSASHAARNIMARLAPVREALQAANEALFDDAIGTYNQDDPDWYSKVDRAKEKLAQVVWE